MNEVEAWELQEVSVSNNAMYVDVYNVSVYACIYAYREI